MPTEQTELKPDEELSLLDRKGLAVIQKKGAFRFGTDSVLLADFALIRRRDRVMDLGAGSGVIALLVASHHPDVSVCALELQQDLAEMAARSVARNGLDGRIAVRAGDIRDASDLYGCGFFDQVICNPPYHDPARSLPPETENRLLSRMEAGIGIGEICLSAFKILKSGGRFTAVFPARRINELLAAMEDSRLAPKRARCVQATALHAPKLMLLDAVKDGGRQMHWLPPLILQNPDGSYTDEWHRIYD